MLTFIISFFAKRTLTAWIMPVFAFILQFWREIIIVALLCLWQLKIIAYNGIVQEFEAFKVKQKTLAEKQVNQNKLEWQARQKIIDDAKTSQTKAVNDIRAYYAKNPKIRYQYINRNGNISLSNNACSDTETEARESTSGTDERTERAAETVTKIDMQLIGEEVTQCINLIEYVKRQDAVTQD